VFAISVQHCRFGNPARVKVCLKVHDFIRVSAWFGACLAPCVLAVSTIPNLRTTCKNSLGQWLAACCRQKYIHLLPNDVNFLTVFRKMGEVLSSEFVKLQLP
jgi:hypothetical protein